jgi:DNA-binding response OmpR family regulator
MNILILEDDKLLRKAIAHHLLEEGHTVSVAADGNEALELLGRSTRPDAIVCDVIVPGLSGPSFILSLKRLYGQKVPAIIIITSIKEGQDFLKKIDIPYDHYLAKPIDFGMLSSILRDIGARGAE